MSYPTNNLHIELNVQNLKYLYYKNVIVFIIKLNVNLFMPQHEYNTLSKNHSNLN